MTDVIVAGGGPTGLMLAEGVDEGDTVTVAMRIAPRGGRQANGTPTC